MCVYPCFDWYHTLLNYQTCCKDYGNGEFHGLVTILIAERPPKGVVSNNKWMVGTLSPPKFPGVRPVPPTEATGFHNHRRARETPGSSKGKGRGKRTKDSDGPSTSGGDGGRKDGDGGSKKGRRVGGEW